MAAERSPRKPSSQKRKPRGSREKVRAAGIEQRRSKAWELRLSGMHLSAIAAQLGCSIGTVHSDLMAVMDRVKDEADDAARRERALSLSRLDAMTHGLWPAASRGDGGAVETVVKIENRRARLLGLDAPAKQEIAGPGGGPIAVEARDALAAKLESLARRLDAAEPGRTAGPEPERES